MVHLTRTYTIAFLIRLRRNVMKMIFSLSMIVGIIHAQEPETLRYSVSYVAASVVYINSGREGHIAVGDTIRIYRSSVPVCTVVITAVSRRSSSASIVAETLPARTGDEAVLVKVVPKPAEKTPTPAVVNGTEKRSPSVRSAISTTSVEENIVSGRVGIQYFGISSGDSRMDVSQPSLLLRTSIDNLYNTGLVFSLYTRMYYDLTENYSRYGDDRRLKNRLYDFSLRTSDPNSAIGYGMGRLSSEYVGGMGIFDGGQFFYRYDNMTAGVLYGAKVQDRTIGVDPDETRGAFFLNMTIGKNAVNRYNGTIAYGRQLVKGNLDREFMYLQNFFMMGPKLSVYQSSEFELNDIRNGVKTKSLRLSNAFVTVNYYPLDWISANVGYDGSRTVYLFESMRTFSDTLLDRNIMQGYRLGTTVRLPYAMSLNGTIVYRHKEGDARDARTLSGSYRIADIARTGIGAGVRIADIRGVYANGKNFTFDIDRTFFATLSVSGRYDFYRYTLISLNNSLTTQTVSINAAYRFSRSLYSSLAIEGVFDDTINSARIYAEIGYRF